MATQDLVNRTSQVVVAQQVEYAAEAIEGMLMRLQEWLLCGPRRAPCRFKVGGLHGFETQPLPLGDRCCFSPNTFMTSHVAWLTIGTFNRSFAVAVENRRRV